MRNVIPFNHDWLFRPEVSGTEVPDTAFERVILPHTNKVLPHHSFDDLEYQFISTYRKRFHFPEPLNGRRLFIDFEGAMLTSKVKINGHAFEEYRGGFTPFSFDLTPFVFESEENLLEVELDSTERPDIPPFGFTVDYLTFGGIYREVSLRYMPVTAISDVFVHGENVLTDPEIMVEVSLENITQQAKHLTLSVGMYGDNQLLESASQDVDLSSDGAKVVLKLSGDKCRLWTLDEPNLYDLQVGLYDAENNLIDTYLPVVRFGLRDARFKKDGFYLNGECLRLRGLNRHQTYPYIGAAAPARLQRKDADILKYELGCNIVRTSHYPQSKHFLNRCDEIGLLVFEEIPGWQHIGDDAWQELVLRDVRAMVERDRNHPGIIIWGVRINESWDHHELYTKTNALARELDPTRPTGGVRFFQNSEFLEDVFTLNDFSNCIQPPQNTPHLVTEFSGHMFPTKSWDNDERRIEHAFRHARVQELQLAEPNVAGAIGWCAFDYNTHREFGAGDRICYHGVMDIFRLPKYAAYFYESQIEPLARPVLRPATNWALGDRDEGFFIPLVVFSNCDEIEVFEGELRVGRFTPDREQFPHLAHPPFVVTGMVASIARPYGDLRIVGYLNSEAVIETTIASDGQPHALVLEPDDLELYADGQDMTRLVFKVVDQYGNVLPYANRVVTFSVEGDAELIGENPFALVGGQAAMYVKTGMFAGQVTIRASSARLPDAVVTLELIAP